jgi:hypothetical protein
LVTLATAGTASATSSGAYGIEANFLWKKTKTGLGPVGQVSGAAPPAYNKSDSIGPFQQTVPLLPLATPVPALTVNTTSIKSHVSSNGISIDNASAEGDASVKGLSLSLALPYAVNGKTPINEPYLQVTAKSIEETTSFSQVFPQSAMPYTSTSISGLVISGSLVNNQTIKFSGDVPNDTILFQSPTVTITVNSRFQAGLISCTPKCIFSLVEVTGNALEISLTNADLGGKIVTGEIIVGQAQAGTGGLLAKTADFPAAR